MVYDLTNWNQTFLMKNTNFGMHDDYYLKRILWVYKRHPDFPPGTIAGKYQSYNSVPIISAVSQLSIDEME